MKKYIEFNIDKRMKSKNAFETKFFKLMNNAPYGKTMENVRKHCNHSIVTSEDAALKHIANPLFKTLNKMNNKFILIDKYKASVTLDKPIFCGVQFQIIQN